MPSAADPTFNVLVSSIAAQIAAQIKVDIKAHMEQTVCRVQPALFTVKESAIYLGRSEQSIQHLIFQNELPVVRVGRRVHLDRKDLDGWIERNKY